MLIFLLLRRAEKKMFSSRIRISTSQRSLWQSASLSNAQKVAQPSSVASVSRQRANKAVSAKPAVSQSAAYKKMLDAEIASLLKITSAQQQQVRSELHQNLDKLLQERRELEGPVSNANDGKSGSGSLDVAMSLERSVMPRGDRQVLKMFNQMSNQEFRRHNGPQLLRDSATYYHLFDDALPSEYAEQISSGALGNLLVSFPGNNNNSSSVWRGNVLTPEVSCGGTEAVQEPIIKFNADPAADSDIKSSTKERMFTVMCLDADTPLMKSKTMITTPLWIKSNISVSNEGGTLDVNDAKAENVVQYTPPHPCKGTGSHRYVWLVLKQSAKLNKQDFLRYVDSNEWDMRAALSSEYASSLFSGVRGMVFHRSMWTPTVTEMYSKGIVKVPQFVAEQNGLQLRDDANGNGLLKTVISAEPVFGKLIERPWRLVNRNLYKYAFK